MSRSTVLLLALASLTTACSTATTAPLDNEFEVRRGTPVQIEYSGGGPRVRFLGVLADYRCPINAACVWAGNAIVEVEVRTNGVTDTLELNTDLEPRDGVVGKYRVRLVSLTPLPTAGVPTDPDAYRATLRVTLVNHNVGPACTMEARAAVVVRLMDVDANGPAVFNNVVAEVSSGNYTDVQAIPSMSAGMNHGIGLAYERAGKYTVRVTADGYEPFEQPGVIVSRDECHVTTVQVTARMKRK